ncbi:hypothetical protein ViPhICP3M1_gp05 [Vibrio phage ICP3]|uniref:Uncharacterized protein orf5 n=1 Tax=Vibrio phage ICP3 TaxID=979535 RepID=F1D001_9CAUD|nr:hypothetical protein ViPhICP3_gp05 [Vibrio phage ICP3]ADX87445.1 hypothetical protein [Vibrio phage ICP3]USS70606.1 hypothetical protein ViPhICP3M1_gp05 [Vibrio phage ICP3]USS70658.1 hypothetical protein ViPhICP3M2_gp05 [Vibrio phage ICP3]
MFEKFLYIILTFAFASPIIELFQHITTGTPWIN